MILDLRTLSLVARPLTREQGQKILERDYYVCQYCGLDGKASFENALVMSVDFLHPRARTGSKHARNLVACCRPCNTLKGRHIFKTFDEAKEFVLARREELRKNWESQLAQTQSASAKA
jgi:5-methylcytosine-specific restriction endonuclease McrA